MSHRHRVRWHTRPPYHPRRLPRHRLPPNQFGRLVGTLDHWTLAPLGRHRQDRNHVYLWIRVHQGPDAGLYEVAVNVRSNVRPSRGGEPNEAFLRYCLVDEEIGPAEWPEEGFHTAAELSYAAMGLFEVDFQPVPVEGLRALLTAYASRCRRLAAYGVSYSNGRGLHDVHLNAGNPPPRDGENRVHQDGAMLFLFDDDRGSGNARWLFLKFRTQTFPA